VPAFGRHCTAKSPPKWTIQDNIAKNLPAAQRDTRLTYPPTFRPASAKLKGAWREHFYTKGGIACSTKEVHAQFIVHKSLHAGSIEQASL
jgi:hypothetical protein